MFEIETPTAVWREDRFAQAVERSACALRSGGVRVLATLLDNGAEWLVADAAARQAGAVHVPLPGFFTAAQRDHAMRAAGVDTLWTHAGVASALASSGSAGSAAEAAPGLQPRALERVIWEEAEAAAAWLRYDAASLSMPLGMPAGTSKITFTSGTTGTPKGVCLGADAMHRVATGIVEATEGLGIERHLNVLPFAVLLEDIAGAQAPRIRGARCVVLPAAAVGLHGSSSFDPRVLDAAVRRHLPNSLILLPQMLRAWTLWLRAAGRSAPDSLKLVAVGGAAVGAGLLAAARAQGIPACEGYGLSEGASVQTLNLPRPGADRPGSAGRPLPHAQLRIAADGEIEVGGSLFLGYLGDSCDPDANSDRPSAPSWWPSGDLGRMDADGFLHVLGRKKQVLITGYGRNVSPEWIESTLQDAMVGALPAIVHAVVFGDGQPALSAVLWPLRPDVPDAVLATAVAAANATLPDYARVRRWVRGRAAFSPDTGLATANGRPQRAAIEALHRDALMPQPAPDPAPASAPTPEPFTSPTPSP